MNTYLTSDDFEFLRHLARRYSFHEMDYIRFDRLVDNLQRSAEERCSWAELVVVAVTEELNRQAIDIPETHGQGLEPADFVSLIQQLASRPPQ